MTSVDRQDVKQWARDDAPIVRVEGVERGPEEDSSSSVVPSGRSRAHKAEGEAHVHEGDNIKSSYDVEEDSPPSIFQKLKGSFLGTEDKFRSKDALQAKNADPQGLTPEGPGMLSHLQQRIFGTSAQVEANPQPFSKDATPERLAPVEKSEIPPEEKTREGLGSEELGTGYEEDTEKGTLSSESSSDISDKEGFPPQSESLFKPVQPKKSSDLTLEELRASKLNQNSNPDDVKAPGIVGRAKEEVEAVTEQFLEGLNLKEKRSTSEDQTQTAKQRGFFSLIAEKMGYGGHGRSQSQ